MASAEETAGGRGFHVVQTEVGRAEVVAKHLAGLPGVVSSEYVTGRYHVVVRVAAETVGRRSPTSFRWFNRWQASPAP